MHGSCLPVFVLKIQAQKTTCALQAVASSATVCNMVQHPSGRPRLPSALYILHSPHLSSCPMLISLCLSQGF